MSINVEKDDVPPGPLRELVLSKQKLDAMPEFPGKKEGMKMFNHILKESKRYLAPTKNESVVWEKLGVDVKNRSKKLGFIPYSILEDHKLSEKPKGRCDEVFEFAKSAALEGIKKAYDQLMEEGGDADLKTLFEELRTAASRCVTTSSAATSSEPSAATSSEPSQKLSAKQATEFLVSVMFLGSLCKRKGERDCIREHNPEITDEQLLKLSELSDIFQAPNDHMLPKKSIEVRMTEKYFAEKGKEPVNKLVKKRKKQMLPPCKSVEESLQERIRKVNELLENQVIKDMIGKIRLSKYVETHGVAKPDYLSATIGVFWDLENLGIPADRDPSTISEVIGNYLRNNQYKGEYTVYGYGNLKQLGADKFKKIVVFIELYHVENVVKMKTDKSDKNIISSALTWAWNGILKFCEPQVLVVISEDIDFLSTIKEVKNRGFKVGVLSKSVNSDLASASEASLKSIWLEITDKLPLMQ